MKYPSQNTFPIPSIVEGCERNSVVKLHNQRAVHLCKTENCCRYFTKNTCGLHSFLPLQVRKTIAAKHSSQRRQHRAYAWQQKAVRLQKPKMMRVTNWCKRNSIKYPSQNASLMAFIYRGYKMTPLWKYIISMLLICTELRTFKDNLWNRVNKAPASYRYK